MGLKSKAGVGCSGGSEMPGVKHFPKVASQGYVVDVTTKDGAFEVAKMYSTRYNTRVVVDLGVGACGVDVNPNVLKPTQDYLVAEELKARQAQVEDGTAEPLIVLRAQRFGRETLYVIDGHHRWAAAVKKGLQKLKAYILEPEVPFELILPDSTKKTTSPEQLTIIEHKRKRGDKG